MGCKNLKYDRKLLEKAVEIYPKEKGRNFVLASKLSQKQLSAAIKHIDKYIKPEDVVAFLDSTLFSSGKEGVILTLEKIASSDSVSSAAYFENFVKAESNLSELTVWYSENTRRRIKIKTYAKETAALLNTIAKLRDEEGNSAPLKTEEIKPEPPKYAPVPKPVPKEKVEPAVKIDMDEFRKFLEMEKTEKIKENPAPVKTEEPVKPIAEETPKKEEILVPDISEDRLFFTGMESYKARMMDYAFAYLKKSAEKGYEPAYYHLGKMYYAGEGTKIDCEKAYFWLKKSAEEKFEPALCLCAEMILCGHLGEGKEKEAVEYLDTAISGGSTKAKELESRFYYVCDKIHREKKAEEEAKAAEKLKANLAAREEIKKKRREYRVYLDGALSGDSRAMLELADICEEEGNECYSEEKLFEAFFWAVFAAEDGNHMAIKKVGEMLENGTGVPVHFGKAIEWYSKTPYAMTERDILAMDVKSGCLEEIPDPESYEDFIATCSVEGEGLCELAFSYEEKLEGFMKLFVAAALGDPDAQYGLGKIYYNGFDFVDPNPAKAKHWLAKAVNNKNSDALEFLRKIR